MFLLELPPTVYSVCFIHAVPCVIVVLTLDLADGISWISAPDEHTYVEQGSPFSLHWHYKMDENETFLSSDIIKTVQVKENTMATRHKGDDKYYLYQREDSSFLIFGKNNISLIVHLAKIGHNVTYCCEVVSRSITGNGKERMCSRVFVYDVPRIIHYIPQLSCKQGDSIRLQCNATGFPKPHLDWIHDDTHELIDSSSDIVLNITGKRSEGRYCCHANNGFGKETACTAVNVTEYEPENTTLLVKQTNRDDVDIIHVVCKADASPPSHHFIIYFNDTQYNSSDGLKTIEVPAPKKDKRHDVAVSCVPCNKYGQGPIKKVVLLLYEYEPENTTLLVKQTNRDDVNIIHVVCKADASPPSHHFIIYFNGTQYNSSDGLKTIEVPAPKKDKRHEVAVSCIPCNKFGQGPIKKVVLLLYARTKSPEITNPYKQVLVVDEGDYVSLVCNASGYPVPNITWTMDGTIVGVGRIFSIGRAKRNDSSCYTCTADNGIGHAKNASICLIVQYYSLISKEENNTLVAVIGVLFALSIVLNIILIAGVHWQRRKDSREHSGKRSIISDEREQMNDIALQETIFNGAENATQNILENEPIGRRGLATSNDGMPEYEEVAARTQPPQPQSGVQTNNPMPQYESADVHGQTEPVSNPPPVTYQNIQPRTGNYSSLSPLTRLPPKGTVLSSTGSPTRRGEYQALQHRSVSPQYQSLDDLSKC